MKHKLYPAARHAHENGCPSCKNCQELKVRVQANHEAVAECPCCGERWKIKQHGVIERMEKHHVPSN